MQALQLQGPGFAEVVEVPDPDPSPGEALLEVKLVGMCGSDLNSFRGRNPLVSFPRIPGHEIAATVVAAPAGHPGLSPGTKVTLSPYSHCGECAACRRGRPNACQHNRTLGVQRDGAMTRYITAPPEKLYPAELSLKELCLVEPLTVGCHAAARGAVAGGDVVAVVGCGGVGLGAVAAAAFRGAEVIALDVEEAKLAIAQRAGAAHAIDTRKENARERLEALTGGRGPDVVIEAVGTPDTFRFAVEVVAFTGRVVYIGYAKEPVCYETRLFVQKELDIRGSRNALPEDFRAVIAMLEQRRFPVDAAVSRIVPLAEAPGALRSWSDDPSGFTKIMVAVDGSLA